jgi:hypothetical protein
LLPTRIVFAYTFLMLPLAGAEVTFTRDVAPILYKHCVDCHHPNDIAPMSLITYSQVKPWAASIKEAVLMRKMPPWKADPHYGKWSNDPSLSDEEIATLKAWAGGAKLDEKGSGVGAGAGSRRQLTRFCRLSALLIP